MFVHTHVGPQGPMGYKGERGPPGRGERPL